MRQQILGTFFYMLYLVAMLQPVVPLIEFYSNKEYIINVLCENRDKPALACNGKCYLEKQLKKVNNQDTHDNSIPKIDISKYPVSLISIVTEKEIVKEFIQKTSFDNRKTYPQKYYTSVFKPPKFLA
ncbi:MAG: hypothetical protein L3J34_06460 [Flavobacteriaceae bacterium]|nr:hypothetical protein [Flavobacteriaceae bacterium]